VRAAQRRFGHRAVHTQPGPVDTTQVIKMFHTSFPTREEDSGGDPLLKAVVCGGLGTQLGLVQRLPLAAGAQDIKDGISAAAIRRSWTATAKAVGIGVNRQQRL
jgi:hypothetical protein